MCHNLAHGDLLGMGYEMWGMGNGACGVVGHGCSPFLVGCVVMGAIVQNYCPTLCEADSAMVSVERGDVGRVRS